MHSPTKSHFETLFQYFTETQAAEYLGLLKPRRLAELRRRGGGPKYFRCGQKPLYRRDWLDNWSEQTAVENTSEEAALKRL